MKNIKYLFLLLALSGALFSCEDGIDPITKIAPQTDATAPQIKINYPRAGTKIKVLELLTAITFDFEVTDDVELISVKATLDGIELASYSNFKDYRRFLVADLSYKFLADGIHELVVTGIDLDGKTTSASVFFEKEPAYIKKYAGEVLYMPFDGDYVDLISFQRATTVGTPGFAGESLGGTNAYAGAIDSYLKLPTEGLNNNAFSAVFWTKINNSPDRAGLLVMGPEDTANPNAQNNRKNGFRLFRENGANGAQRFKLNVGNGIEDHWVDGGKNADVNPNTGKWVSIAISISQSKASVYIDGVMVKESNINALDFSGCDLLSIGSGAPRFAGWNHKSDLSYIDELRIFDKALSKEEIQKIISDDSGLDLEDYQASFAGEIFYMPFNGTNKELFSKRNATEIGSTSFLGVGKVGSNAHKGSVAGYLSMPTTGLTNKAFSASMWYKVDSSAGRAGILVMGPPEDGKPAESQNNRKSGFRLFREGNESSQVFKINVGNGTGEHWVDGGDAARIDASKDEWVHLAIAINATKAIFYLNGEIAKEIETSGLDWTGCDLLSIGSGNPRFNGWDHKNDPSAIDELRIFDTFLSSQQVKAVMNAN
jgi:hypothetical protein